MSVAVSSPAEPAEPSSIGVALDYERAPKKRSLGSLAASGAAWTFGAYAFGQVFRLASNLVLTRLLVPDLFGLMALVQTILTGVHMFADIGVGPAIIQRSHGRQDLYLHTAFSVQAIRGVVIWAIGCLVAFPAAWFYDQSLAWVMPIVAFTAVLDGVQSTSLFTLNRDMSFKAINLVEIGSQVFGTVVMILFAWWHPTIWALIVGTLAGTFARTALSHLLYRMQPDNAFRDRFAWDRAAAADLLGFGRWITLSSATTFLAMQMDRLVLAKLIGLSAFGVYNIAVMLATVASSAVVRVGQAVVFPAFSRVLNENRNERDGTGDDSTLHGPFRKARRIMLVGGGACVAGIAGTGPDVVAFLYDHRYQEGGLFVSLLAISAWFQILDVCNAAALLAHGRAKWLATGNVAKLVGLGVFLPIGYVVGGVHGAIIGVGLADMAKYFTSAFGLRRHGLDVLTGDMAATGYFTAASFAIYMTLHHPPVDRWQALADICVGFAIAFAAAGALYVALTRRPLVKLARPEATRP